MEYNIIYNNLIESRQHRPKERAKGFELHHITPKSIGGTDSTDNLVSLTPKEHFIAHRLLVKIHTSDNATKMALALHRMATGQHKANYNITSRTYDYLRKLRSNAYKQWLQTPEGIAFKERQRQRGIVHKLNGTGYGKTSNKGKKLPKWSEARRAKFAETIRARKS
jgi:hypothetical protein